MEQLEVTQNKRQNAWQQFQTTKGKTKKVHLDRFCIWYVAISKFWDQWLCPLLSVAICISGPFIFIELRVPLSSEWSPNSHYYVQFYTLIPSHKFGSLSMYLIFCLCLYCSFYPKLQSPPCIVRLVSFRVASGKASSSLQKTHKARLVWQEVERVWPSSRKGKNTCISRERLLMVLMNRLEFLVSLYLQDLAHDQTVKSL